MTAQKPVGLTAAAGYQIGVRRTIPVHSERVWEFFFSPEGLHLWLGDIDHISLQKGQSYATQDGITGEVRVVKPCEQVRMTWNKAEWAKPSTLQVRFLIPGPDKTTISFHQEKLVDMKMREAMKQRWEQALTMIAEKLKSSVLFI
ncbi:SRPBCC family protein [Brevibacillus sp. NRS-1366]|uniref:SRPBCC family protein n=1 Tax=Brevibacillus sp. NRS-1366 TaxID=3233899 RepID=UPI003D25DDC1